MCRGVHVCMSVYYFYNPDQRSLWIDFGPRCAHASLIPIPYSRLHKPVFVKQTAESGYKTV